MRARSNNSLIISLVLLTIVVSTLVGCQGEPKETPTKGYATWVVSDEVMPVMQLEKAKFEELYQEAHVTLIPATTREAIVRLYNDTIKTIVSSRPLNAEEQAVAKQAKLDIAEYTIALDGVAIIVNSKNPVARLRTTELDSILTGSITDWKRVGGTSKPIRVCLPSRNVGDYEVVMNTILHGKQFGPRAKVVASATDMLRFVMDDPAALGMVGMARFDEKRDSVKALALADPDAPDSLGIRGQYFAPFQAHIYRHFYPLTRDISIYSRADEYGVASGFITFIMSVQGQQIVLNSGLVPATMPVRLVELTNKGVTP